MGALSDFLALQSARIAAGLAALDAEPGNSTVATAFYADADPVPAALTAEAMPVFKSCRPLTGACASYADVTGRQIARMAGNGPAKIKAMLTAIEAVAMPDLGALDVI